MIPEREAELRKWASISGPVGAMGWERMLHDALAALDTERIATQTADAIAHRFERELVAERGRNAKLEKVASRLASLAEYPLAKRSLLATAARDVRAVLDDTP